MLRSRIIPCLLIHKKGLVKTVNFKSPKYVGDPINAVKIFNEKEVDELVVFDIDASVNHVDPDYSLIEKLALECRMPLCYGGGIKNEQQARRIVELGVEKVAFSSAAIECPELIASVSSVVGSQSVVVVIDAKKGLWGGYNIYSYNGQLKSKYSLEDFLKKIEANGVGEIMVNSIDQDGVMKGYDLKLASKVRELVDVPITILGGAGSKEDVKCLIHQFGTIGAAAGSLFVFKGPYKAVLINYFSEEEKQASYS